jgi:hypothetical protein
MVGEQRQQLEFARGEGGRATVGGDLVCRAS